LNSFNRSIHEIFFWWDVRNSNIIIAITAVIAITATAVTAIGAAATTTL